MDRQGARTAAARASCRERVRIPGTGCGPNPSRRLRACCDRIADRRPCAGQAALARVPIRDPEPGLREAKVNSATIKVGSDLDRGSVSRLVEDLDREIQAGPERVTVDLGAVERFDSAGLGGIVE